MSDTRDEGPARRDFLKTAGLAGAAGLAVGKFAAAPIATAQAQTPAATTPPWWPSRWGADDEKGASNWMTPQNVLRAARTIQDGRMYRLGRTYETGMPMFGARAFALRIPGSPTGGPFGSNKLIYHDEFLATEIGQVGTQFDGLGHIGLQLGRDGDKNEMRYYNGHSEQDIADAYGLKKLGIEKLNPIFAVGTLIDMVAVKGGMMDAGQEITMADVRAALALQQMSENDIGEGAAVCFNTGWGSLWMKNNDRYNAGCPGIGFEVARWLISRNVTLVGADTWPVEVIPNPDKNLAFAVHAEMQTKNGIFFHENLTFDTLLADRKHRFVYSFTPVPIKGGTGSAGCPVAIT
ncbi:kynurenine formamidase [Stella humosa]|uniref:Kynurenine formamidase n=1 Tax=Stella humosa TaxID=94 RepID=A0A3N1KV70_9PROT|nr:cyclase family protein [Stella humosa]ROP83874.1 kynurenine formamidase [Stella humosa]BBK32864.1 cyclase [Stella humosa]